MLGKGETAKFKILNGATSAVTEQKLAPARFCLFSLAYPPQTRLYQFISKGLPVIKADLW